MSYTPGQYVTLRVPVGEGEPLTRSWTVANNPTMLLLSYTNSLLTLAIKRPKESARKEPFTCLVISRSSLTDCL